MPRFHFNIYDGVTALDREGIALPDLDAARVEAIRFAGESLRDDAHRLRLGEDWHMDVTDETGLILFRLDFNVFASAAATLFYKAKSFDKEAECA